LNQGLFEAQNLLVIDLDRCTRCDLCVRACAEAHDGVTRLLRDGLRYDKYLVATTCRTCRDPLCMTQCPVGSIRRKDNLEIIIEDWCIGCSKCAELCPFGNINMHPVEFMEEVKAAQAAPVAGAARRRQRKVSRRRRAISARLADATRLRLSATPRGVVNRYFTRHLRQNRWQPRKFDAHRAGEPEQLNARIINRQHGVGRCSYWGEPRATLLYMKNSSGANAAVIRLPASLLRRAETGRSVGSTPLGLFMERHGGDLFSPRCLAYACAKSGPAANVARVTSG
jgi:Fe-S-cluster-containing hydrogenase component 2